METSEQRRKIMRSIPSKDTKAEVLLRKALYHVGYRYRKNWTALPGKPDIVLTKYKICVFCDSEFFHGKSYDAKPPVKTNCEYWDNKIRRNMERDKENNRKIRAMGWTVLRFWDTEISKNLEECMQAIKEAVLQSRFEKWQTADENDYNIYTRQDHNT